MREVGWAQVVGWVQAVERLRATGRGRPGADGRAQRICRLRARERRRLICRKRASTDGLGDSGWFGRMRMVWSDENGWPVADGGNGRAGDAHATRGTILHFTE